MRVRNSGINFPLIHSPIYSFTYPLARSLTHLHTHLHTHSLADSPTHSFTHTFWISYVLDYFIYALRSHQNFEFFQAVINLFLKVYDAILYIMYVRVYAYECMHPLIFCFVVFVCVYINIGPYV